MVNVNKCISVEQVCVLYYSYKLANALLNVFLNRCLFLTRGVMSLIRRNSIVIFILFENEQTKITKLKIQVFHKINK